MNGHKWSGIEISTLHDMSRLSFLSGTEALAYFRHYTGADRTAAALCSRIYRMPAAEQEQYGSLLRTLEAERPGPWKASPVTPVPLAEKLTRLASLVPVHESRSVIDTDPAVAMRNRGG